MPKCCPPDSKKSLRNRQGYTDCIQLLINVYLSQRLPNRCSRTAVCRVKNCSATKAKQDGAAQVPCFVDQLWSGLRPCTRRAGIWRKNPSSLQVLVAFLSKKVASVHLIPRRLQPRQIPAETAIWSCQETAHLSVSMGTRSSWVGLNLPDTHFQGELFISICESRVFPESVS